MGGELLHVGVGADVGDGGGEHQHLGRLLPHQVLATLPELGEGAVEEEGLVRSEPRVWCTECTMVSLHSLALTPIRWCIRCQTLVFR